MKNRPLSVTIISWLLIVVGLNTIFLTLLVMPTSPADKGYSLANLPSEIFYLLAFCSAGICLFSGVFMLGGANWTRYIFLAYGGTCLGWIFIHTQDKGFLFPGVLAFAIVLFFLFKPGSREFFVPRPMAAGQDHGIF